MFDLLPSVLPIYNVKPLETRLQCYVQKFFSEAYRPNIPVIKVEKKINSSAGKFLFESSICAIERNCLTILHCTYCHGIKVVFTLFHIVLFTGDRLYYWLMIVSVAVVYNSWVLILRTSFPELHKRHEIIWITIDYLCDIIYILDFFVSSRTGYMEDGIMQKDIQKMRRKYLHTSAFYLDAASVVPLDIAYIFIDHEPAIRMNRLIKYHRFWLFLDRTESRTSYPNMFRLASLMQFILVIIHWNACIYFIVSREIGFGSDTWVYPGFAGNLTERHLSLTRKYVYSFYWSTLTLTTIGEVPPPHTNVEYIIVTLDYLIGRLRITVV